MTMAMLSQLAHRAMGCQAALATRCSSELPFVKHNVLNHNVVVLYSISIKLEEITVPPDKVP